MLKITVVALTLAVTSASLQTDWIIFKQKFNKTYSVDEDSLRRYIYHSNMKVIQEHNKLYAQGKSTFFLGENQFADWTNEEFNRKMNGMNVKVEPTDLNKEEDSSETPDSVDWRAKGYVTPVKNQGLCGSCYAFSATGSMEGQHFNSTKKLVSLSEANIIDCSDNLGCDGGLMDKAFNYVIGNKGIDTEAGYPYAQKAHDCRFKREDVGATISGYVDVQKGSEKALQKAVASIGPVSVAVDAALTSFQLYHGGVYDDPNCSSTAICHGMLAVGYGSDGGKDYWIVKNSWGARWGEKGYIRMSRNKQNQCGIASLASYPTV